MASLMPIAPLGGAEDDGKNKSKLQVILSVFVENATPQVPLSASDSEQPFEITISARQTWSADPSKPITISTWRTPFNTAVPGLDVYSGDSIGHHVQMQSVVDPERQLPLGRDSARRQNYKDPTSDNWRDDMGFITIPSFDSGESFSITRVLERSDLFQIRTGDAHPGPKAGEEFALSLDTEFYVAWWNWGDLGGDLADKKFLVLPNPKLNGKDDAPPADPYLLPYGCWEDEEDEEGNEMVFLQVDQSKDSKRVKFVE